MFPETLDEKEIHPNVRAFIEHLNQSRTSRLDKQMARKMPNAPRGSLDDLDQIGFERIVSEVVAEYQIAPALKSISLTDTRSANWSEEKKTRNYYRKWHIYSVYW